MKIIGNPDDNKFKLKNLIFNLNIDEKYLKSDLNFRNEIIDKIKEMCKNTKPKRTYIKKT